MSELTAGVQLKPPVEGRNADSISVVLFGRKPYPGQYSIEASFARIGESLKSVGVSVTTRRARNYSRGLIARLLIMIEAARIQKSDILHVTGDIHFSELFASKPIVLTIHDLQMLSRLNGWRRSLLKLFWFTIPCRRADRICVVSNATKHKLLEQVSGIEDKVSVVPSVVSDAFSPLSRSFNNRKPRIFVIGTKPNKNLPRLAAAISGIPATLVVLGSVDENLARVFSEHKIELETHVGVDQGKLIELYASADLLAMVSIEEGFGMPIIEAQRMRLPIVTSNVSSMPEVAGDGAVFVDPNNTDSIRDGILKVIQDKDVRDRIIANGTKNAERFSSKAAAQKLCEIYSQLLDV